MIEFLENAAMFVLVMGVVMLYLFSGPAPEPRRVDIFDKDDSMEV